MPAINYNLYYRMYGIRRLDQMTAPPLPLVKRLGLPVNSYLHYIGVGPLDDGPTESETVLQQSTNRPLMIANILDLSATTGNPRKLVVPVERTIRLHRNRNPRFRPMRDLVSTERDNQVVGIFNYSYLHRLYRYDRNIYSNLYRWRNIHETVWDKVASIAAESTRHQFIEFSLPRVLPNVAMLNQMSTSMNQKLAAIFSSSDTMFLLELWKWLGVDRKSSLISKINPLHLDRVNVILRESNRWLVINLGTLNSWRAPTKAELLENPNAAQGLSTVNYPADRMQRYMLRLAMSMTAARDDGVEENLGTEEDKKSATLSIPETDTKPKTTLPTVKTVQPDGKTSENVLSPVVSQTTAKPKIDSTGEFERDVDPDEVIEREIEENAQLLDTEPTSVGDSIKAEENKIFSTDIDADLNSLNDIADNAYKDPDDIANLVDNVEYTAPIATTPEEAIIAHANLLADSDSWPTTEYRRAIESAAKYKQITAPDGTPLGEFIQIPSEMVKLDTVSTIPDKSTIIDKSMLQSSLLDFDRRYVKDVMQRDIANMVVSLQNAGILVTDYKTHVHEDISGGKVEYTVRIKPLQGVPSTLRFKLPLVQEDGSYRVNNVTYRTRKQRGDLPIRKLTPSRVALTSYYGKIFVERSSKKVNDYGNWLRDNIMSMGLTPNHPVVTDIQPGNAFDHTFEAPRLYTMIAQGFRAFNLNVVRDGEKAQWKLIFDHSARVNLFASSEDPKAALHAIENPASGGKFLVVGQTQGGRVLVMDRNGAIYENGPDNQLYPMPPLDKILGIAENKSPVEYAEIRVFGKMIPLGVVLCYLMGINEVCHRLGVKPVVIPAGQRATLSAGDWSIVFQDETWIFNRDNTLATLILGGLRDYRDSVVNYTHQEFNKHDVYLNLLEDNGLGPRYLRELDLQAQMFLDPIAKELLAEMKEPQIWTELLFRSAELLSTDNHPHELDARYMRIKGYERFAGAVYSELVKSVRVHNAKGAKAAHPVEMNPYAVWIQISEDPAKDQSLEINPIKELKEIEAVTYSGTGGRSGRSMVKRTRAFPKTDLGTISEATSDSSDVGINVFLSANPLLTNLRGTTTQFQKEVTGATSALSTSALLAPAADRDD